MEDGSTGNLHNFVDRCCSPSGKLLTRELSNPASDVIAIIYTQPVLRRRHARGDSSTTVMKTQENHGSNRGSTMMAVVLQVSAERGRLGSAWGWSRWVVWRCCWAGEDGAGVMCSSTMKETQSQKLGEGRNVRSGGCSAGGRDGGWSGDGGVKVESWR